MLDQDVNTYLSVHEALLAWGFGHRKISHTMSQHEIYNLKTGNVIGVFYANEAAKWLQDYINKEINNDN